MKQGKWFNGDVFYQLRILAFSRHFIWRSLPWWAFQAVPVRIQSRIGKKNDPWIFSGIHKAIAIDFCRLRKALSVSLHSGFPPLATSFFGLSHFPHAVLFVDDVSLTGFSWFTSFFFNPVFKVSFCLRVSHYHYPGTISRAGKSEITSIDVLKLSWASGEQQWRCWR